MVQTKLTSYKTPNARVKEIERGWRLSIPAGNANEYRNAQLDDYARLSRRRFPHRFIRRLSLLACASSDSIPGTWGFGLWNDPFGLSLGFGGNPFRLPALPNAVWFFGASKENYLSFQNGQTHKPAPTNGFMAQVFRSPKFHPLLIPAGLALAFSRKTTRQMLGRVIAEEGSAVSVNAAEWHRYSLTWEEKRVSFEVDNIEAFKSDVSPKPPLGLVVWIDNQYASFTPDGKVGFGVLANPEPAWLEIKELEIRD